MVISNLVRRDVLDLSSRGTKCTSLLKVTVIFPWVSCFQTVYIVTHIFIVLKLGINTLRRNAFLKDIYGRKGVFSKTHMYNQCGVSSRSPQENLYISSLKGLRSLTDSPSGLSSPMFSDVLRLVCRLLEQEQRCCRFVHLGHERR